VFTSAKWLAMAHGAGSQSMTIVTAYDTLGQEGLTHSLVQTHAKAIFLDPHLLPQLMNPLDKATEVHYIIYNTESPVKSEHIDKLKDKHPRLTILSFEDLVKLGQEKKHDPVPPSPEDLMGIMYTSGSTGPPKGVPLLHKAVVAAGEEFSLDPPQSLLTKIQFLVSPSLLVLTSGPAIISLPTYPSHIS